MSAEAFGSKLLAEVQEESLASLLSDLRAYHQPQPCSVTGLPELDRIIEVYRYGSSNEAPVRGEARSPDLDIPSENNFDITHDDFEHNILPNERDSAKVNKPRELIINVSRGSHGSASADTALLYHLAALSTIPRRHYGKESSVVFLDCVSSFSANQLYGSALSYLSNSIYDNQANSACLTDMAKDVLNHVHVSQCKSSQSLFTTIKRLRSYLFDPTAHRSSDRPVGLVIVHGINNFYWEDRSDAEIARLETNTTGTIAGSSESSSTQIVNELKGLQKALECTLIYTSVQTATPASAAIDTSTTVSGSRFEDTSLIPAPNESMFHDIYSRNALLNLQSHRINVAQFGPTMVLEDCLRDREKRSEAVDEAKYRVDTRAGGLGQKQEAKRPRQETVGFEMHVFEDGVIHFE